MRFKRDVNIKAYKLHDSDDRHLAMSQLSLMANNTHKFRLRNIDVREDNLGGVSMTLEWLDYIDEKQLDQEQRIVYDCQVICLSEDGAEEASGLLTNANGNHIHITERREWTTKDGDPMMFLLWKKNNSKKQQP